MIVALTWTSLDTWIVVTGVLVAISCGLLGSFLVLRQMSMLGDAISHAVLPGLAAAFLLTQQRDSLTMFLGAVVIGVLTAVLTQAIHRFGRVETGASMGVVFTTLFALGLVLIVRAADAIDLDPGCVLYGAIELTPSDTVPVLGAAIPRAALVMGACTIVNVLFVVFFFKELKITSFDPALATTLGIRSDLVHYALMALVAMTAVAAFEAVGSILVVAMLIVPAATAHLLTDRLWTMLLASVITGAVAAALGHLSAITIPPLFGFPDTSTAGAMAVCAGGLFTAALLFAPRHGALSRIAGRAALRQRIVREDVLGLLYRLEESGRTGATADVARVLAALPVRTLAARVAFHTLRRRGLVENAPSAAVAAVRLTPVGRRQAETLVRSHRLWESYLTQHTAIPADHVHGTAMDLEHVTGDTMRERLAEDVKHPKRDPHGRVIPGGDADRES